MNPVAAEPAIVIDNLVRRYGRVDAVNGLSMRVEPGRCYGFFGRNGAGKTTTIKCLLNLLRPTSGTLRVFGLDPTRQEVAVKSKIAYVPDHVAFYPWMTVTVFVSTHLISEFEGLIDEFTIIDKGREVITLEADAARQQFQRIRARFAADPGAVTVPGLRTVRRDGREFEFEADGTNRQALDRLRALAPESIATESLPLEEIFVAALRAREAAA